MVVPYDTCALFYTREVLLETWLDTGLLDREKLIYEEHLKRGHLERVYWLTYGSHDAELAKELHAEKINDILDLC
jgi:hypothetical protein